MDTDEWLLWQQHLPEILPWCGGDSFSEPPDRGRCLEAVEQRAFALTGDELERFRAVASNFRYARLPDEDLEYLLRIFLAARTGRHPDLELGETGRLLLQAAEKRHRMAETYLEPFRELVLAEQEKT
jgi:hypothetical protein